ncbi:MAG: hypothetical protein K1W13_13665 [Lachnospiraceae bacterium]
MAKINCRHMSSNSIHPAFWILRVISSHFSRARRYSSEAVSFGTAMVNLISSLPLSGFQFYNQQPAVMSFDSIFATGMIQCFGEQSI